jgi:hypothetical protein
VEVGQVGSRVELFEEIRRDRRAEALSIRELAERHKVHRRAVRQALASALPPPRKEYLARSRPAIDPWAVVIDAWLIADQDVHRKQRHTARRVWQRLVAEHGAVLSEVTVSRYVTRRRVELDLVEVEVCIPQTHEPGAEAEVDFGEFYATIVPMSGRQSSALASFMACPVKVKLATRLQFKATVRVGQPWSEAALPKSSEPSPRVADLGGRPGTWYERRLYPRS